MPRNESVSKSPKEPQKTAPKRQAAQVRVPGRPRSKSGDELSRHEREARTNRMLVSAMGAVVLLIVAVLAFGAWREYVARGSEPVASVDGHSITIESYARQLGLNRNSIEQQIQFMQAQLQSSSGDDSLGDLYRQQIAQLQLSLYLLPEQTLDRMIEDELVRQEADRRGLRVYSEEIDQEIAKTFGDPPAPAPTVAPTDAGQPTSEPGVAPTPAPVSPSGLTTDAQTRLSAALEASNLTTGQYRSMVEIQLLRQKLEADIGGKVPTSEEQVHARHILVETEEKAREVVEKLKGGASFEELAKAESTDPGSKENGGDLGWFPRDAMVAEFDKAAFELPVKQVSDPVQSSFGWHLIEVLEKEQNRTLESQMLSLRKSAAFSDWLEEAQKGTGIKRLLTEEQKSWVYRQIKWSPPA